MKKLLAVSVLAIALGASGSVSAGPHFDRYRPGPPDDRVHSARVLEARPIYETVRVSVPETHCWQEKVYYPDRSGHRSYTGTIAGAIVGGVVGNQFGHGRGRDAATVAGVLLGGSIGNDLSRDSPRGGHYEYERRCETVDHYETHEEVVGYRVKYRYKGETYWTRMDHHPGDTIDVRVQVDPVRY